MSSSVLLRFEADGATAQLLDGHAVDDIVLLATDDGTIEALVPWAGRTIDQVLTATRSVVAAAAGRDLRWLSAEALEPVIVAASSCVLMRTWLAT